MTNDQNGAIEIGDDFLKKVEGFQVEVVGRLVQNKQIGDAREFTGEKKSRSFSAGENADLGIDDLGVEQEVFQIGLNVFAIAPDVDPVAALGQNLPHGAIGFQQPALLVDHHTGQVARQLYRAAVRFQFTGEHLQQCRFSGAVRTDDADAVPSLDTEREWLDDRFATIRLRYLLGHDDGFRFEIVVIAELQLGRGRVRDHRRALRPHLVQLLEPALIALAAGGHSALQPVRLELQLGIELLRCARFFGVHLLFPGIVPAKADFLAPEASAVEPQCRTCQPFEKRAVMADDEESTGVSR